MTPTPTKPELTAERIERAKQWAEGSASQCREDNCDTDIEDTILAVIESRKQALELLRLALREEIHWSKGSNRSAMGYGGLSDDTVARITAFLERNQ